MHLATLHDGFCATKGMFGTTGGYSSHVSSTTLADTPVKRGQERNTRQVHIIIYFLVD